MIKFLYERSLLYLKMKNTAKILIITIIVILIMTFLFAINITDNTEPILINEPEQNCYGTDDLVIMCNPDTGERKSVSGYSSCSDDAGDLEEQGWYECS